MNWFKNKKYLIWTLWFLLLVNISAISTMVYHVYFQNNKKEAVDAPIEFPDSRMGRFFKEQLELDPEQNIAIRQYHQAFYPAANQITAQLSNLRREMLAELSKEHTDSLKLNQISDAIGHEHADLKKLTWNYYLNLKKHCNESQKAKLAELFQSLMNTEELSKNRRQNNQPQQRRQRGRFKNNE